MNNSNSPGSNWPPPPPNERMLGKTLHDMTLLHRVGEELKGGPGPNKVFTLLILEVATMRH